MIMNKTVLIKVDLEGNWPNKLEEAYKNIEKTIENYNNQGYKVVSITPLTAGVKDYDSSENQSYGYGYSFTTGILIVFENISL